MSRRLIKAEMKERAQLRRFHHTQGQKRAFNLRRNHYKMRSEVGPSRACNIDLKRELSWDGRFQVGVSKDNNYIHVTKKDYFTIPRTLDEWSTTRQVPSELAADPQYLPGITFSPKAPWPREDIKPKMAAFHRDPALYRARHQQIPRKIRQAKKKIDPNGWDDRFHLTACNSNAGKAVHQCYREYFDVPRDIDDGTQSRTLLEPSLDGSAPLTGTNFVKPNPHARKLRRKRKMRRSKLQASPTETHGGRLMPLNITENEYAIPATARF